MHGRVVNVASGAGSHGEPDFGLTSKGATTASYAISKAAVNALTSKLAAEFEGSGLLVNSVDPGLTATAPGMEAWGRGRCPRARAASCGRRCFPTTARAAGSSGTASRIRGSHGSMSDDYEQTAVESREGWRAWLKANHATQPGVWAVTWKRGGDGPYVAYPDIVEEALCFGWVDSRPRTLDDHRSQLLVTPRKPGSGWSRPNKERVERLEADGLMAAAGLAAVEAAKADGSWTALDAVEDLVEPGDLAAALDDDPDARRHWDAFPRSAKRAILEWISTAKRDETRAKRVGETARLAAENVRANQWRQPKGR